MKILITGGAGFLGRLLAKSLLIDGHQVWALTRSPRSARVPEGVQVAGWDGRTARGWGHLVNDMDAIVNLAGKSLSSWPWTRAKRQEFYDSRVHAGRAIVEAIKGASHRPDVLLQISGINHYGLRGEPADESTPPADDFLARLTIDWEAATQPVEELGVRRVVARSAVVLANGEGLFPLMALPVRLFIGGRLGTGQQIVPWIHAADEMGAMRFLIDNKSARGAFNLIAPEITSMDEFMRAVSRSLRRPFWFPTPAFLLRLALGGMSDLILEGRASRPGRLTELGYRFQFPGLKEALADLFSS